MSKLLSKSQNVTNGYRQQITPANTYWDYVGFELLHLEKDQQITVDTQSTQACFVMISGYASFTVDGVEYQNLGNRTSSFEKMPPYSLYVPHNKTLSINSVSEAEIAICRAPSKVSLPVRVITPDDVGMEQRGFGNNKHLVHNILPETEPADALLVVEVKVPKGYHPVAILAGYDNYYLNVMAGPVRKWKFTWEQDHAWINTPEYENKFK